MPNRRPRIFIGASLDGLPVARELKLGLAEDADCTLWTQGAFALEKLVQAAPQFNYAVLVLGPADLSSEAAEGRNRPRDSTLFQIGLFAGLLGRSRMLLVHSRDVPLDLPPDLAHLRTATFGAGKLESPLAEILSLLRGGLEGRTARLARLSRQKSASPTKAVAEAHLLDARSLIERALQVEDKPGESIEADLVEGVWRDEADDTTLVVRMIGGEMRAPYAFRGATRLTGEFFGWKLREGVFSGHFRWMQRDIEGRVLLRAVASDRLEGVWFLGWADRELLPDTVARIAQPIRLVRQRAPRELPVWAEEFFRAAEVLASAKH
ncbi:TIR domain-containing protein [Polyangium jinanense]|uniref:Nucleotide-binding protein n=1 Tax=Polyangium jinanense TaxID=2829994 RepID=A0A9X4AWZ9_9BACT|nr:TIR domain-containing protein [Polyangium jinanense]MDC3962916.1 nucleotide-binding protein [Polyangium jinanense]MDC3987859.1 nucleotide-binding protein [Polyangium jinanense]